MTKSRISIAMILFSLTGLVAGIGSMPKGVRDFQQMNSHAYTCEEFKQFLEEQTSSMNPRDPDRACYAVCQKYWKYRDDQFSNGLTQCYANCRNCGQ